MSTMRYHACGIVNWVMTACMILPTTSRQASYGKHLPVLSVWYCSLMRLIKRILSSPTTCCMSLIKCRFMCMKLAKRLPPIIVLSLLSRQTMKKNCLMPSCVVAFFIILIFLTKQPCAKLWMCISPIYKQTWWMKRSRCSTVCVKSKA